MLSLEQRNDSWQNLLSGLGTARDKSTYTHYSPEQQLPLEYLEQIYHSDDIAARIIDLVPNEMLRQGFLIDKTKPNPRLKLKANLYDALVKARLFGAAFIYLGVEDFCSQDKPIKLKKLKFINVISDKDISAKTFYNDALKANFGEPQLYELKKSKTIIHESRLIPFYGTHSKVSLLQRVYPVLQQFNTAWQATSHLMSDAAQGVFKLKGLHSSMSSNRSHELLKRMELVDMSRSVSRSILLDAEDEDFRRDAYSFAGIPQVLEKMMLRLAAAARIPVTLLMGQSPAGLNATGDSDIRFFYDQVRAEQESLKPKIERIYSFIEPDKTIEIEFPALWQLTDKEQADVKRTQAETDRIYLQEGVVLPEEIALLRFPQLENSKHRQQLLQEHDQEKKDE